LLLIFRSAERSFDLFPRAAAVFLQVLPHTTRIRGLVIGMRSNFRRVRLHSPRSLGCKFHSRASRFVTRLLQLLVARQFFASTSNIFSGVFRSCADFRECVFGSTRYLIRFFCHVLSNDSSSPLEVPSGF